jgi:hypothetical protein
MALASIREIDAGFCPSAPRATVAVGRRVDHRVLQQEDHVCGLDLVREPLLEFIERAVPETEVGRAQRPPERMHRRALAHFSACVDRDAARDLAGPVVDRLRDACDDGGEAGDRGPARVRDRDHEPGQRRERARARHFEPELEQPGVAVPPPGRLPRVFPVGVQQVAAMAREAVQARALPRMAFHGTELVPELAGPPEERRDRRGRSRHASLSGFGHTPDGLKLGDESGAVVTGLARVWRGRCARRRHVFRSSRELAAIALARYRLLPLGGHITRQVILLTGPGEPPGERCRAVGIELVVLAHGDGIIARTRTL